MTDSDLIERFGQPAVAALRTQLDAGASPQVDINLLKLNLAKTADRVDVDALLDAAQQLGWLARVDTHLCVRCGGTVEDPYIEAGECPFCTADLTEPDLKPKPLVLYVSEGPFSRSVPWLVAIHGFNTRGAWQEEFSWLIASLYRYRAPVLIYKYGLLRVGVLFRWRHTQLVAQLGARIQVAANEAVNRGIVEPPDVIAHSFGTQLFRLLLERDDFTSLKFGRVITIGSVIRPDFEWSKFINEGRIEAVLNQCGGRDGAVPAAQFTIPNTGPGGRHGFTDTKVKNVRTESFKHSTALSDANLVEGLHRDGAFERFLRLPLDNIAYNNSFTPKPWSPWPRFVRLISRSAVIILIALVGLVLLGVAVLGTWQMLAIFG